MLAPLCLALCLQEAAGAPRGRATLRFEARTVQVVDLARAARVDPAHLWLPIGRVGDCEAQPLVDGWFFWVEEQESLDLVDGTLGGAGAPGLSPGLPLGLALEAWRGGEAIELRARHAVTGEQRAWSLPALARPEPDDADDREEWPPPCPPTASPRIVRLPSADGFLLQDSAYAERAPVELHVDGSFRERDDLGRAALWVDSAPRDVRGRAPVLLGISDAGCWRHDPAHAPTTAQPGVRLRGPLALLSEDPGWGGDVRRGLDDDVYLRGDVVHSNGWWVGILRRRPGVEYDLSSGPIGPGARPPGPIQSSLVALGAATGAVVAAGTIDPEGPFGRAARAYDPCMWTSGEAVVSLAECPEGATWRFAVARPSDAIPAGPGRGSLWTTTAVAVQGLDACDGEVLVGKLSAREALYQLLDPDGVQDGWLVVRAP
ncbi:MAG: hypothetical protein AAGB93_03250 [Planctomycetota bacterium]